MHLKAFEVCLELVELFLGMTMTVAHGLLSLIRSDRNGISLLLACLGRVTLDPRV